MGNGTSDAVVIGAGVLGASTAFRLAEAGLSVTILEAGRVGAGTSGMSFAWLNANGKPPRAYHDLNVAGLRAHYALREEFAATPWLHEGGCIEIVPASQAAALQATVARLREWHYAAEFITPDRLAELEPELDLASFGPDPVIAWYPEDGWIDPVVFAQAMIRRAQAKGAALHIGTRVTEIVFRPAAPPACEPPTGGNSMPGWSSTVPVDGATTPDPTPICTSRWRRVSACWCSPAPHPRCSPASCAARWWTCAPTAPAGWCCTTTRSTSISPSTAL
jgi:choline dehydrogenase-like flavoprotein